MGYPILLSKRFPNPSVWSVIFVKVKNRYFIPPNSVCVITVLFIAGVIFHFHNNNLSSRFPELNLMNAGISPNSRVHLKYYITDRTCWCSDIYFMLIHQRLKTQLGYTKSISVSCIYIFFIYIFNIYTYIKPKKKTLEATQEGLALEILKSFSLSSSHPLVLLSFWAFFLPNL